MPTARPVSAGIHICPGESTGREGTENSAVSIPKTGARREQVTEEKTTEKIGGTTHVNTNVLWASNARIVYSTCAPNADGYPVYQVSSYGLYELDADGLTCIYPGHMPVSTELTYFDGKLYFPTDSQYHDGALDWMEDRMCVINLATGGVSYIPLEDFEAPWESEVNS